MRAVQIPVGLKTSDGHLIINPLEDAVVLPTDELLFLAEDDDMYSPTEEVRCCCTVHHVCGWRDESRVGCGLWWSPAAGHRRTGSRGARQRRF